jgi:hypothetical protein
MKHCLANKSVGDKTCGGIEETGFGALAGENDGCTDDVMRE